MALGFRRRSRAVWLLGALCAPLCLSACGSIDSKSDGESLIRDYIHKQGQGKVAVRSVTCPAGVDAKAGHTYQCQLTTMFSGALQRWLVVVHVVSGSKIEMHGSDLHPQVG